MEKNANRAVPSKALLDELQDYITNAEIHHRRDDGTCWIDCADVYETIDKFTRMVSRRKSNAEMRVFERSAAD